MSKIGKANATAIKDWKAKYGDIYQLISTDDEGNEHYTYVRKPDIDIISASAKYAESDPIKSGMVMINSIRIGGSEEAIKDIPMLMGIFDKIGVLTKAAKTDLGKL